MGNVYFFKIGKHVLEDRWLKGELVYVCVYWDLGELGS